MQGDNLSQAVGCKGSCIANLDHSSGLLRLREYERSDTIALLYTTEIMQNASQPVITCRYEESSFTPCPSKLKSG